MKPRTTTQQIDCQEPYDHPSCTADELVDEWGTAGNGPIEVVCWTILILTGIAAMVMIMAVRMPDPF